MKNYKIIPAYTNASHVQTSEKTNATFEPNHPAPESFRILGRLVSAQF